MFSDKIMDYGGYYPDDNFGNNLDNLDLKYLKKARNIYFAMGGIRPYPLNNIAECSRGML